MDYDENLRWEMALCDFGGDMDHLSGCKNILSDSLSFRDKSNSYCFAWDSTEFYTHPVLFSLRNKSFVNMLSILDNQWVIVSILSKYYWMRACMYFTSSPSIPRWTSAQKQKVNMYILYCRAKNSEQHCPHAYS